MKEAMTRDGMTQAQLGGAHLRFRVTSGLHEGVDLQLDDGDYVIGSTPEADIVLRDAAVAGRHLILCIEKNEVRAEAIGGPIRINDEPIEQGFGYMLTLPAVVEIGDAVIKLAHPGKEVAVRPREAHAGKLPLPMSPVVIGAALTVFVVAVAVRGLLPSEAGSGVLPRTAAVANATQGLNKGQAKSERLTTAASALRLKLAQAGLDSIHVLSDGTRLEAVGKIPEARMVEWTSIQHWFDEKYAPDLMLAASVSNGEGAAAPPLHLESIWLGERPHIIADNGMRYYEGAVTNSGWILQSIQYNRITLRKGGDSLNLNFR